MNSLQRPLCLSKYLRNVNFRCFGVAIVRPALDYEPRETEGLISNEGEIKAKAFLFDLRLFLFLFLFLFLLGWQVFVLILAKVVAIIAQLVDFERQLPTLDINGRVPRTPYVHIINPQRVHSFGPIRRQVTRGHCGQGEEYKFLFGCSALPMAREERRRACVSVEQKGRRLDTCTLTGFSIRTHARTLIRSPFCTSTDIRFPFFPRQSLTS